MEKSNYLTPEELNSILLYLDFELKHSYTSTNGIQCYRLHDEMGNAIGNSIIASREGKVPVSQVFVILFENFYEIGKEEGKSEIRNQLKRLLLILSKVA